MVVVSFYIIGNLMRMIENDISKYFLPNNTLFQWLTNSSLIFSNNDKNTKNIVGSNFDIVSYWMFIGIISTNNQRSRKHIYSTSNS